MVEELVQHNQEVIKEMGIVKPMYTISQIIEDVKCEMCDTYCKYPIIAHTNKDKDWLFDSTESPCLNCPLNRL